MERRRFLVAGVGGAILPLSGCLTQEGPLFSDSPYEIESVTVSSGRTSPDHPYTIESGQRAEAERVGEDDSVVKLKELPAALQSVFTTARHDSYGAESLPNGTRRILNEYDFIDFGEDVDAWRYMGFKLLKVDLETPPRLRITAELLNDLAETDDPALVELRAQNTGDKPLQWSTGAPSPFGTLQTDEFLLWADSYEESSHVSTENGEITAYSDVAINVKLDPGESAAEEYEIQADQDGVDSGVFRLDKSFRTSFEEGRETVTATLTIEID